MGAFFLGFFLNILVYGTAGCASGLGSGLLLGPARACGLDWGGSRWGSPVLSPRSGLSALDRCARGCLVDGDFHQVNGRHLCRNLPSQYPVSRDLLVLLVHFVGGPLSWVASRLLHLIRNQE